MKIGIIVYSQTGHTLEVCGRLQERLQADGHEVSLERILIQGERTPSTKSISWAFEPDPTPYEGVVFASYVEAFSLCSVMRQYLSNLGTLQGKKVACFVTQQFPYRWMGGNRAVRQAKQLVQAKNGDVQATAVVNWAKSKRAGTMAAAVERLSRAF